MTRAGAIVIATRNAGKVRELVPWFADVGVTIETLDAAGLAVRPEEQALECHDTFEANALAKARHFFVRGAGRVVMAEDSGLEVSALHGAPGVRSKRWSGSDALEGAALDAANNATLRREIDEAAAAGRTSRSARYVCAAACVWGAGELVVRGEVEGTIVDDAVGGGGFGYDPHFFATELGATFASVSRDEKARVSHRGRAFSQLLARLVAAGVVVAPVRPG